MTNTSDILKVDVTPGEISLKPGEEVKLDVTLQRRPDFDKNVTLDVPLPTWAASSPTRCRRA